MRWREWTTPELLWVVHYENVEYYREHEPKGLRRYLDRMGDEVMLRAVDLEATKGK